MVALEKLQNTRDWKAATDSVDFGVGNCHGFWGDICIMKPVFYLKTCQADSVQKKASQEKVEEKTEIKKSKTKKAKVKRLEEPLEDLEEPLEVEKVKKSKVVTSHPLESVSSKVKGKKRSKRNDKTVEFVDPVDPGEKMKKPKKASKKETVLPEVVPKASKAIRYALIFSDFSYWQLHFPLISVISDALSIHHQFILLRGSTAGVVNFHAPK